MSTTKRRLEKAEIETRAICPPERTLEDDLKWRLEEVLLHKRYFPFGCVMASLNTVEHRKCLLVALEELQSPYREQVEEALAEFAVRHPAKWLLQYVVYVGFQHYHFGAPLRIPPQVCDWLLEFDPTAYGYKDVLLMSVYAYDFCYDCGICYPVLDPPLVKQSGVWHDRPFADKQCFDCSGPIMEGYSNTHVSSPARKNNQGWRERQERVKAVVLPEALQYETWDWEKIIREAFEALK